MSEVEVRAATPVDDRALAVLDAAARPPELWVSPPRDAAEPFFHRGRPVEDVLVATVDGVVIGYVRLARHLRVAVNDHVLHLDALAVSPAARGRGTGSRLIEAAVEEAQRRGACSCVRCPASAP